MNLQDDENTGGVKIYERPKTAPSKVKAITIVVFLLLLVAAAFLAFYLLV